MNLSMAVVTYNHQAMISRMLASVEQTGCFGVDKRAWLIDNGSSDQTVKEAERFHRWLQLIQSPRGNIGFGAAHNLVLPVLDSDYHLIVNPDIVFHEPDALQVLCTYLDEHPDVGLAVPQVLSINGQIQHLCRRDPTIWDLVLRLLPAAIGRRRRAWHTMQDHDYQQSFEVPFASGCLMLVRTSLFHQLAGFDERFFLYAEDADLSRRIRAKARVVYVPEARVTHLWQRDSYHHVRQALQHVRSLWRYFRKWGFRWS